MDYTFPVSTGTSYGFKTGTQRTDYPAFTRKTAPCIRACPLHVDIPTAMELASKGDFKGAMEVYLQENPIPGVTGRVCYHPCEGSCNRGRFDSPLSIRAVERSIAEHEFRIQKPRKKKSARLAVVGAGPAGLACAFHLARKGYPVTLFEKKELPGGMLRYGIPAYRLPRNILDRELARIFSLGVDLRIGKLVTRKDLTHFDAIFYAPGLQSAKGMFEGDSSVISGLEFLGNSPAVVDKHVLVVGGGNVGIDVARTCVRSGAEAVTVLSPEVEEEMPAFREEVLEAREEGVELVCGYAPIQLRKYNRKGPGVLEARPVTVVQNPFQILPREGQPVSFRVDKVIVAIGQKSDDTDVVSGRNVFFGGDFGGAQPFVADALASGRDGAFEMIALFENVRPTRKQFPEVMYEDLNVLFFRTAPRNDPELLAPCRRKKDFSEVRADLGPAELNLELARCFRCGVCVDCGLCKDFCPDVSILQGKPFYSFDVEYCKGCGVCATACPRFVIEMKEELR